MKQFFLITVSFIISVSAFSQKNKKEKRDENKKRISALIKQEEEGVIAYEKSTSFGAKLTSDGYGIFFELGRAQSVNKGMLYQLEIGEHKSIKEDKQSYFYSTPFIYGKQNFFYPVKLGLQQERLFGNKSNKNGVTVTYNYGGGISMGLVRPYYVKVGNSGTFVKYDSPDSAVFLDPNSINAGPGFSKGWSDLTVSPGLYAKAALRFDYGAYNEMVSALEVGITGEYYSKNVPIMVHTDPKKFFFTGYVAVIFGKRK